MIIECRGNLLDDQADVLVCTTNVTGPYGRPAMGAGIAKAFKMRWPSVLAAYSPDCLSGALTAGQCRLYDLPETRDLLSQNIRPRRWAAFCTKRSWQDKSEYGWVQTGLVDLVRLLHEGHHTSVAIPRLGCSNGGLDWSRVYPLIIDAFKDSPVAVHIYI